MYLQKQPRLQLRGGDILVRPKHSGLGNHYGTMLSMGAVAHTTPEYGKHLGTIEEFAAGKRVKVIRPNRSSEESFQVEFKAVEDLGRPYYAAGANCEQDITRVHEGEARSPTVQLIVAGLLLGGACVIAKNWD